MLYFAVEKWEFENPRWQIQDGCHQNSKKFILTSSLVAMVTNLSHTTKVVKSKLRGNFGSFILNQSKDIRKSYFCI